ncbi:MAG: hypothetical protein WBO06_15215, partial [Gammaproteobacteria bacterium]
RNAAWKSFIAAWPCVGWTKERSNVPNTADQNVGHAALCPTYTGCLAGMSPFSVALIRVKITAINSTSWGLILAVNNPSLIAGLVTRSL